MAGNARIFAPAKLNLHLQVKNRRSDGFHELISLFQAVSFGDEVSIRKREGESLVLTGMFDCPPEKNTALIAASEFFRATGIRSGLNIEIEKHIPVQAGLGGGSSDAAAVIRGLDAMFETGLSVQDQAIIGLRVGSDVPFFLSGVAGIVSGRGELVFPIVPRTDFTAVVVWPGFGVSTKDAYRGIDESADILADFGLGPDDVIEGYSKPLRAWNFGNSFQDMLEPDNPGIAEVRKAFLECGASVSMLSGSGSAVFGLFDEPLLADRAFEIMRANWPVSFRANPLALLPPVVLE